MAAVNSQAVKAAHTNEEGGRRGVLKEEGPWQVMPAANPAQRWW